MSDNALFSADAYQLGARQQGRQTPAQVLRARQSARIEAGYHPLSIGTGCIRLHPEAPRVLENDQQCDEPFRCGSCRYRVLAGGHARDYPKCHFGRTDTRIPPENRLPYGPRWKIRTPRATNSASTDCRAWWPACTDYQPRGEAT